MSFYSPRFPYVTNPLYMSFNSPRFPDRVVGEGPHARFEPLYMRKSKRNLTVKTNPRRKV